MTKKSGYGNLRGEVVGSVKGTGKRNPSYRTSVFTGGWSRVFYYLAGSGVSFSPRQHVFGEVEGRT